MFTKIRNIDIVEFSISAAAKDKLLNDKGRKVGVNSLKFVLTLFSSFKVAISVVVYGPF